MTRAQKIEKLLVFCNKQKQCRGCKLDKQKDIATCDFMYFGDAKIDALMYRAFGTPVTDDLTGTAKEEPKTITEFFDGIKSSICDNYCKYPGEIKDYDELIETVCSKCPLRKLN